MSAAQELHAQLEQVHKSPIPGVSAQLAGDDELECHFVVYGTSGPYKGGEYYGLMRFHGEYPITMEPVLLFVTPTGKFPVRRQLSLKAAASGAGWTPSWTLRQCLETARDMLLNDRSKTDTAIQNSSDGVKAALAASSAQTNGNNMEYVRLFGHLEKQQDGDGARAESKTLSDAADEPVPPAPNTVQLIDEAAGLPESEQDSDAGMRDPADEVEESSPMSPPRVAHRRGGSTGSDAARAAAEEAVSAVQAELAAPVSGTHSSKVGTVIPWVVAAVLVVALAVLFSTVRIM